jgi:hypothetical protein
MAMSRRTAALAFALVALVGGGGAAAVAAISAPSPFELTFEGRHEPAADSPVGVWHVGPFTASGGFCSSGTATTLGAIAISATEAEAIRLLTCADGSGSVTARVFSFEREHEGVGTWRVVEGTGQYVKLRGQGRFTSVRTGGDPRDHGSLTFRSNWTGVTDIDDVGPAIAVSRATAAKLRRPRGSYRIRLAFSAQDTPGSAVRYEVIVKAGFLVLDLRTGQTTSGMAATVLRILPLKRTRTVRVEIKATDAVGNESTLSRSLRLPRR